MSERAQSMVCRAEEIAETALRFYAGSIEACGQGPGREVFARLLEDERREVERIHALREALDAGGTWAESCTLPDVEEKAASKVSDLIRPGLGQRPDQAEVCVTEMGAIAAALELEKERVDFYEQWLAKADDPTERRFVQHMVQEARGNHLLLSDLQYFYEDPKGWSLKEDHQILDGA
jgi:rubrerythrin